MTPASAASRPSTRTSRSCRRGTQRRTCSSAASSSTAASCGRSACSSGAPWSRFTEERLARARDHASRRRRACRSSVSRAGSARPSRSRARARGQRTSSSWTSRLPRSACSRRPPCSSSCKKIADQGIGVVLITHIMPHVDGRRRAPRRPPARSQGGRHSERGRDDRGHSSASSSASTPRTIHTSRAARLPTRRSCRAPRRRVDGAVGGRLVASGAGAGRRWSRRFLGSQSSGLFVADVSSSWRSRSGRPASSRARTSSRRRRSPPTRASCPPLPRSS